MPSTAAPSRLLVIDISGWGGHYQSTTSCRRRSGTLLVVYSWCIYPNFRSPGTEDDPVRRKSCVPCIGRPEENVHCVYRYVVIHWERWRNTRPTWMAIPLTLVFLRSKKPRWTCTAWSSPVIASRAQRPISDLCPLAGPAGWADGLCDGEFFPTL